MNEDSLLTKAIIFFTTDGWQLIYRTRSTSSAIAGVDAILLSGNPWQFIFIEAKGSARNSVDRSAQFTSALGTILKRIRFERGYIGLEAKKNFIATDQLKTHEIIDILKKSAIHRNSEYVLAFDPAMKETIKTSFDPALASILHIRVLFVNESITIFHKW